ncbi:unnamed protein product [Diamesa serratosioi]
MDSIENFVAKEPSYSAVTPVVDAVPPVIDAVTPDNFDYFLTIAVVIVVIYVLRALFQRNKKPLMENVGNIEHFNYGEQTDVKNINESEIEVPKGTVMKNVGSIKTVNNNKQKGCTAENKSVFKMD